jgi:hypothetical protein
MIVSPGALHVTCDIVGCYEVLFSGCFTPEEASAKAADEGWLVVPRTAWPYVGEPSLGWHFCPGCVEMMDARAAGLSASDQEATG